MVAIISCRRVVPRYLYPTCDLLGVTGELQRDVTHFASGRYVRTTLVIIWPVQLLEGWTELMLIRLLGEPRI